MVSAVNSLIFGFLSSTAVAMTPIYLIENAESDYLQVTLTHDVYRYFPSGQLHRLAVIDHQGNKLPYRIRTENPYQEHQETFSLPFYPIVAGTSSESLRAWGGTKVRIQDHTVAIDLRATAQADASDSAPVDFYLLDMSEVKKPISHLVVDWQADAHHQYLELELSGTRDLQQWTSL